MARLLRIVLTLAVSLSLLSPARAAVIDFDATTNGQYLFADYEEDGYLLTKQTGHYDFFGPAPLWCNLTSGNCVSNFLNVDSSAYGPATIRFSQVGGGTFNLLSFDVLDVYQYNQQTYQFSACGANCLVRSSKGGQASILAGAMDFADATWQDVDWIEFYATSDGGPLVGSMAIDNLQLAPTAVPAPATFGLLAAALGSLAVRRSRHRAS